MKLDAGIPLPASGRLVCFYFDGTYDDFDGIVGTWDVSTLAGVRLLHLDKQPATARKAPDRVPVFEERMLTARQITTAPTWEQPAVMRAFGVEGKDVVSWFEHPVCADAFTDALYEWRDDEPWHQLGGWADPVQGPIELEAAQGALAFGDDHDDSRRRDDEDDEAERWTLLLQVDSDGDMCWGDVGKLYWLARHDDLAAANLADTMFTWQCT